MSLYIARNDLLSQISDSQLNNFTDDLGDGSETTSNLNTVMTVASNEVDSYLASIYTTPFSPVPAKVKMASIIFACEALYARRLTPDEKNPFKERATMWRKLLIDIGSGKQPLDESFSRGFPPVVAITQPSIINVNPLDGSQANMF